MPVIESSPISKISALPQDADNLSYEEEKSVDLLKERFNISTNEALNVLRNPFPGEAKELTLAEEFLNPVNALTGGSTPIIQSAAGKVLGWTAPALTAKVTAKEVAKQAVADQTMGLSSVPSIVKAVKEAGKQKKVVEKMTEAVDQGLEDARVAYKQGFSGSITATDTPLGETAEKELSKLASRPPQPPPKPPRPPSTPKPAPTPPPVIQTASQVTPQPGTLAAIKNSLWNVLGGRVTFAPSTVSEAAEATSATLRAEVADMALKTLRAETSLKQAAEKLDAMPLSVKRHFIIAFEQGYAQGDAELDAIARSLKQILDSRHRDLSRLGILRTFHENYFPHIWKDPNAASQILAGYARRPLEGSKAFTKRRTIPTFAEGLNAGLEPLFENPVTATLFKLREIDKAIMAAKVQKELKALGLLKYVKTFDHAPTGWVAPSDKMFTAMAIPKVTVKEAFDKGLMDQLTTLAQSLGIKHYRGLGNGLTGPVWGWSQRNAPEIASRFGGPESVVAHEIGHQIGKMFPAIDQLVKDPTVAPDILRLASLRYAGQTASAAFKRYARSIPERHAVLLEALIHAPEVFRDTAPALFFRYKDLLASTPQLKRILSIKPSLVLGTGAEKLRAPGLAIMGKWYTPKEVGLILDRYLSPGLYGRSPYDPTPPGAKAYEVARVFGNMLNQAQLGLSFFHLTFTGLDAAISSFDVGLRQAFRGLKTMDPSEMMRGAWNMGSSLVPGLQPYLTLRAGDKLMKEVLHPGTQASIFGTWVKALTAAGGRARMDKFYHTNAIENFKKTFRASGGLAKVPLAWRWFPAMLEAASFPTMEYLVPRMKMGVFMKMAQHEINALPPTATSLDYRKVLAKVWDHVDNRMGQLVYDNLFWNRMMKDIGMLSIRSLGWNVGTVREVGGAITVDIPKALASMSRGKIPEITPKIGYLTGMIAIIATYGAAMQYLLTGEAPKSVIDMFAPRTGFTREDGAIDRVMLPSYMRDIIAIARQESGPPIIGPAFKLASHKLHPDIAVVTSLLENRDFMNALLWDPSDPVSKQAYDMISWIVDQYVPIGTRAVMQSEKTYGDSPLRYASLVGITPAPSYTTELYPMRHEKMLKFPRRFKARREFQNTPLLHKLFGGEPFK